MWVVARRAWLVWWAGRCWLAGWVYKMGDCKVGHHQSLDFYMKLLFV